MSEHMAIKGKIEFYHCPMDDESGFAYCHRCKEIIDEAKIKFNQGIANDWIQFVCGKCNKTIWVASLHDEDGKADSEKVTIKDDKLCCICKQPTNHYDCLFSSTGSTAEIHFKCDTVYVCSKKCEKEFEKLKVK